MKRELMEKILIFVLLYACLPFLHISSDAGYTLTPTDSISYGQELTSAEHIFVLGFFRPGSSNSSYIGIWYKFMPQTVIWVANREKPLNDPRGNLTIDANGNIVLFDGAGKTIWSTNCPRPIKEPIAKLLDTGNLVLMDGKHGNSNRYIWQSFDYPTDTLVPGMKLGWDKKTGLNRRLTSWKSADDPSAGNFTYSFDHTPFPFFVLRQGLKILLRSGVWNGVKISGATWKANTFYNPEFNITSDEVFYWDKSGNILTRLQMRYDGLAERYIWDDQSLNWTQIYEVRKDFCAKYGACGAYGICNIAEVPVYCECLKGFKVQSLERWDAFDYSSGCSRKTPLNCTQSDKFIKISNVKLPMLLQFWANDSMSLEECKVECLKNCSCTAYANSRMDGRPHGCLIWFGDLIDLRRLTDETDFFNQDLYVRLAASDVDSTTGARKRRKVALIISPPLAVLFLLCFILYITLKNKDWRIKANSVAGNKNQSEEQALPLFDIVTIVAATDKFSRQNKIGEGGFGPVYKGKLAEGQEIAVKRLSKTSKQGITEFKNEVGLVAKLQHRNLVRVLGGCIDGEERMLVYEYMPNRSLDRLLFGKLLNWRKRNNIVMGIARGLLYLHQDARLTIIHRDLKTSNILLDDQLNPKISDFGMAHIFEGDNSIVKVKRIVGTYGYMSPEYGMKGLFSIKSYVFSFGVIVLEILSGIRNNACRHRESHYNLLEKAWILWKEGRPLEFMDVNLDPTGIISELLRCLQVGLLCVQRFPEDRPTMLSVVCMLGNESIILPQPKEPAFFNEQFSAYIKEECFSNNALTISLLEARS